IPRIDNVKPRPFKFHNHLTSKDGFIPVVKRVWSNKVDGFSMFSLVSKLKMLKKPLCKLNFDQGNLFENVKCLKAKLAYVQSSMNADPHNNSLREEKLKTLKAYKVALKDDESFLGQKSKVKWLRAGKRNRNKISYVEDMNGIPFNGNSVGDQFVCHFKNMLGRSSKIIPIDDPEGLFLKKLSDADAVYMVRSVSDEEIKLALFVIDGNKAPGPDVNATVISLVPKLATPSKVFDYRPIACCNVVYKIISKVICNRIKGALNDLVDGLAKCAFKIDIMKAYDSVEWEFLANYLKNFGFHEKLVKWVMSCVTSTSFTINVNGEHKGFFKGMRGLTQGDPLSPYLFTLIMEVLIFVLRREISRSPSFKYHWLCKEIKLTHLYFANDLLLFCNRDSKLVAILNKAFKEFGGMSGLLPNNSKSTVFFGNIREISRLRILNIMPFREGSLPVRARKRILDWKNKSLSFAGRLLLIKSVVSLMQVYWASMFILLISISKEVEKLMRDFLWNFRVFKRGKSKVNWCSVCKPKVEGGLGIKSLDSWNIALMSKHVWNIITHKESLWV
ncbi:RNA-directed DNA polymerase, eukaryota, reverse transcriptase zinc-binding domain protein, partial [Tanacetum coccineum]